MRLLDNRGVLRPEAPDPVPPWLVMPADKAAKPVVHAIVKRKPEVVITGHGKVAVFLARHFPRLTRALLSRSHARQQPGKLRQGLGVGDGCVCRVRAGKSCQIWHAGVRFTTIPPCMRPPWRWSFSR